MKTVCLLLVAHLAELAALTLPAPFATPPLSSPPTRPQPTPQQGPRPVRAEFKHLDADMRANKLGFVKELSLPGDDLHVWELKLWAFDDDLPGGKDLNQDLACLKQE